MKRLAKILAALIGLVVVLIILAAVLLPLFFDPNAHKEQIEELIEEKIGREVAIPGTIELSIFPWLGIKVGEVNVANAPEFGDEPMAEIAAAAFHVKLLPLLQRQVELGTVTLEGLHLRLARDTDGQTNWAGMFEQEPAANEETAAGERDTGTGGTGERETDGGFELQSLEIEAIKVSDAVISWNDAMTSNSYQLSDFDLATGHIVQGEPIELQASTLLAAPTQGFSSAISLNAELLPDTDSGMHRFDDLELRIQTEGDAVPGDSQQLQLTGQGAYDANKSSFTLDDLRIEVAGLQLSGQLHGRQLHNEPVINGHLAVARFEPRAVLQKLGVELPELRGEQDADGESDQAPVLEHASLDMEFSATAGSANIGQLQMQLDDSTLKGSAEVTDFAAPAIVFVVDVDHFNFDRYRPV
ncbi:MAG TPA: AsmA family protein, partial [Salinisphaeraceae bacterium]|nr:AsmA family protein [Salinisphaeraceae bacterium]